MSSIVCGVVPSDLGREAARAAGALAACLDARLVLVHAVPASRGGAVRGGTSDSFAPSAQDDARSALHRLAAELPGDADCRVVGGDPRQALLDAVAGGGAAWLVVGCSGRPAISASAHGELATYLAGRAPCPELVVPSTAEQAHRRLLLGQHVVVGVGDHDRYAVEVGADLAAALSCPLVLVRAIEAVAAVPPSAALAAPALIKELTEVRRDAADRALEGATVAVARRQPSVEVQRRIVDGRPSAALKLVADDCGAAVLVVGSRGRGPLVAGLLGSTSRELCTTARHPVAVCPRTAVEVPGQLAETA